MQFEIVRCDIHTYVVLKKPYQKEFQFYSVSINYCHSLHSEYSEINILNKNDANWLLNAHEIHVYTSDPVSTTDQPSSIMSCALQLIKRHLQMVKKTATAVQ